LCTNRDFVRPKSKKASLKRGIRLLLRPDKGKVQSKRQP
jgi:hypothetical protein